jgi:DNA-binding LacI/PurR family transcriptional regulator
MRRNFVPTIRLVAKACNVSPMTVSHVLNGKVGEVSEETRERVLKTVREMGYRPAARKHPAEARAVCTLGIVAGIKGDTLMLPGYFTEILTSLLRAADRAEQNVTLFANSLMHADPTRSLRIFCDGRCDGLIVIAPAIGSSLVKALEERGFPFVMIGDTGDRDKVSFVDLDNWTEAYKVVEYLVHRGHRRIGYRGGAEWVRSANDRYAGYMAAMRANHLEVTPDLCIPHSGKESFLYSVEMELQRLPADRRATAIFCWNDDACGHVVRAIKDSGQRIPDDVSVVGFDDHPDMMAVDPPVTTLRQPYAEIGERAIQILLEQIRQPSSPPHRDFLQATLLERGSVASLT